METEMETYGVTFTPDKLTEFKAAIKAAGKKESFTFEQRGWLTEYARFLAAYLEGVFLTGRRQYKK